MDIIQKCTKCKGIGLIKTIPIKCVKCIENKNISGCIYCKSGYTQLNWEECSACFETGLIMPFNEYVKLLHS